MLDLLDIIEGSADEFTRLEAWANLKDGIKMTHQILDSPRALNMLVSEIKKKKR